MIDGIPVTPVGGIIALLLSAVLGLVVRAVVKGDLIPRRTYDDMLRDRDNWRAAHQTSELARAELAGQGRELLEHARTTDAFIRSVSAVAHTRGGSP